MTSRLIDQTNTASSRATAVAAACLSARATESAHTIAAGPSTRSRVRAAVRPLRNFAMMPHDSPSMYEMLCPAHPGNPRRYIEGESPRLWKGKYRLLASDLV